MADTECQVPLAPGLSLPHCPFARLVPLRAGPLQALHCVAAESWAELDWTLDIPGPPSHSVCVPATGWLPHMWTSSGLADPGLYLSGSSVALKRHLGSEVSSQSSLRRLYKQLLFVFLFLYPCGDFYYLIITHPMLLSSLIYSCAF